MQSARVSCRHIHIRLPRGIDHVRHAMVSDDNGSEEKVCPPEAGNFTQWVPFGSPGETKAMNDVVIKDQQLSPRKHVLDEMWHNSKSHSLAHQTASRQ